MIVLYTDFGVTDPYVGQMRAVLAREAPGVPVIDLLHAVPDFDIRAGAYLLAALAAQFAPGTVFVGVVDPGVGGARRPIMLRADGRWYVGPDNGLFHVVARRARAAEWSSIDWRPARLSASFHGRDLFAPAAARLARGEPVPATACDPGVPEVDWPEDLPAIIYIDHYGNAMTGLRAAGVDRDAVLAVAGRQLQHAPVFSAVTPGMPFWYENSIGLIEVAENRGSAAATLGLRLGDPVELVI
ncbi:MAG TPA: SAM-dependent chlorinase/fluorinase [Burkholderiales bacterium]